ncbi:hypothetical protein BBP40_006356 [Aspergillus hancockii]|nr:hypothetical protein BBP40_006356 [Aspergillus hancockii]
MRLTKLVTAKVGAGRSNARDTRTIENHRLHFEEIQKQVGGRILKMVKENPRRDTPYALMIAGIKTCIDCRVSGKMEMFSNVKVGFKIPLREALKAAGVIMSGNVDVYLDALGKRFRSVISEFVE